jgi:hypothetical protein
MGHYNQEDIDYLKACIKKIEEQVNWGSIEEWTNHHFTMLSHDIEGKTGDNISVSSIRRIFGQDKKYKGIINPQIETKNTLARYIGFTCWLDFKANNNIIKDSFIKKRFQKVSTKKNILFLILAILSISLFFFIPKSFVHNFEYTVGNAPRTIYINYNIKKYDFAKYTIGFGEFLNPPDILNIDKKNHNITHSYLRPYFYKLSIFRNKKRIAYYPIVVSSDGWDIGVFYNNKFYDINKKLLQKSDELFIDNQLITSLNIDTNKIFHSEYKLVDTFLISADNMVFETDFKVIPNKNIRECLTGSIRFLALNGDIKIKFADEGCASITNLNIGEISLNGRHHDLSNLCFKLTELQNLKIITNNSNFQVFIKNKLIYETSYNQKLGQLRCIHISFLGNTLMKNTTINSFIQPN